MGRVTTTRGDQVVREPDVVGDDDDRTQVLQLAELRAINNALFDASRPVDEYRYITGNITSLEILPDYEPDELIEAILIVANPYSTALPLSQGLVGSVATPSAGASIVATSTLTSAVEYTVGWSVQISGGTATHANNFGLYYGTNLVATSMNSTAAGTYPQPAAAISWTGVAMTISVAAIASESTVTYQAQLVVTPAQVANVITCQLGDRYFNVTMPPSGIYAQDGLGLRLARHDRRYFTQPTAGPLGVNLMGHADMSGI